jgi:polyferredoxin
MNRHIQNLGLILFFIGFGIFIASFFIGGFQLKDDLSDQLSENEIALLRPHLKNSLNEQYAWGLDFVKDLDQAFDSANDQVFERYAISERELGEISSLVTKSKPLQFSIAIVDQVYPADDEVTQVKHKAFQDYGSWLEGREYEDVAALNRDLQSVAHNFNRYGLINQLGFDQYRVKNLKFELAKTASYGPIKERPGLFLWCTYGLCILGALLFLLPKIETAGPPGIKNHGIQFSAMKNRGWLGILTGTFLIVFYVLLYFYPEYMTNWIVMVDPVSQALKGSEAGRFFLYGFIYTLCILVMGVRMLIHYRHSNYQIIRTISVMFFQTAFAFLIPELLLRLNKPYFDFKNIWPLDYDFFFDNEISTLVDSGALGIFMLGWGIALIVLGVPIMVYFFGKRWYCSWVCGCGGLAETLGDPYRQLSDKSLKAWKIERWMVHGVLVFAVLMTAGVLYTYWTGSSQFLGLNTYSIRSVYGAWIGAGFAGVVGTGFYPLMGNRVWCRFGCPLAAYLGLVQRYKSRFRITTNGGQCISCGNCSTYCEMGIDVRWYAQRGQNIIRSSCVGCGICSAVCPRGVLNLENASEKGRFNQPDLIGNDSF